MGNLVPHADATSKLQNITLGRPTATKKGETSARTSFQKFPSLPLEIRQMIWAFSIESPRIIGIATTRYTSSAAFMAGTEEGFMTCVAPTYLPYPILNTNREARQENLRVVQNITLEPQRGQRIPKLWVDLSKDILWFQNAGSKDLITMLDWLCAPHCSRLAGTETALALSYHTIDQLLQTFEGL